MSNLKDLLENIQTPSINNVGQASDDGKGSENIQITQQFDAFNLGVFGDEPDNPTKKGWDKNLSYSSLIDGVENGLTEKMSTNAEKRTRTNG